VVKRNATSSNFFGMCESRNPEIVAKGKGKGLTSCYYELGLVIT
jgi:hypothetical protein